VQALDIPFDRHAYEERNRRDAAEANALAGRHTPEERVRMAIELIEFGYRIVTAGGVETAVFENRRFEDKARRLAAPLRLLETR